MSARRSRIGRIATALAVAAILFPAAGCPAGGERAAADAVVWEDPIQVASGDAFRGPWRMNESNFDFVDDPTVAIDESGRIHVAWADQASQDIFFQRFGSDGTPLHEDPARISGSPGVFSWLPRIVPDPGDPERIYVLWQEIVFSGGSHGGEIFFARSENGGVTFSDPVNLSDTPAGAGKGRLDRRSWHNGSLDLAAAPDGRLYAAWTEYEGPLRFSRSLDGGDSFSDPILIAGGGEDLPARGPSLAVGPDGAIHLAWTVGEDPSADIRVAFSTDAGATFSEPGPAVSGSGHADAPRVAVDSGGTIHLVYAESPAGRGGGYGLRYARSSGTGAGFTDPRAIDGRADDAVAGAHFPALHLDADDRLYLVWELFPDRRGRSQGLGFAFSADGGDTFSAPATIPGSRGPGFNGSQQGLLMNKLAVGRDGRFAVVNSTYRAGDSSRIALFRARLPDTDSP